MNVNQAEQPAIDLARGTRLIDIGCGDGKSLVRHGIGDYELVVGVDINLESILKAKMTLPGCHFVIARGESLPFADGAFDRAISNVSITYMNVPKAIAEASRVLMFGGTATIQLHDFRFALRDLWRRTKTRSPRSMAGGIWTVFNGFAFHFIGRCFKMPASTATWDSWQSRSAMKAALRRAGFTGRIEMPYLINVGK
ncbi:MAG: class I SAM-dependent methyltransferase [Terriglobia bacterium]